MLTWDRRKHPDETLDYYFDLGPLIEPAWVGEAATPESITSIEATVISGTATISSQTAVGAMLQLIVTGGAAGEVDIIEVVMVTSKGRTYTEQARLRIGTS